MIAIAVIFFTVVAKQFRSSSIKYINI